MFSRKLRICLISFCVLAMPLAQAQSVTAPEIGAGTPITGAAGITEKVSDIMVRAAAADAAGRSGPRMKYEFENEYRHPQNGPGSPAVAFWPPLPAGQGESGSGTGINAAQTVSTPNFTGATLADTGAFPPDTMGTVGPTQFIVAVNGRIRSFNKFTGVADGVVNADSDVFFSSVMTPGTNFTSDPRIRYDRLSGRWFVIIIDVPGGAGAQANRVLLAVSSGSTITALTDFTFYQFQMSGTLFADYPTLGIDNQALYIGANMFTLAGSFSSTLGSVVRKSSVLSGGPIVTTTFTLVATGTGAGPFTPQGVDNYDPAATEGYFVGVDNATFGTLMVRRVSTPGATPTISGNLSVSVPTTAFGIPAPHSGNTGGNNGQLDSLDDRLFAAHVRGGRLWTAHNIGTTNAGVSSSAGTRRNSVRWYELGTLTTTPSLIQSGTIFSTATVNPEHYFIPSVMVSGQGHAAFGFTMSGLALTPNAGTIGRLSADTAGTVQAPIVNYSASTATYNPASDPGGTSGRRWGDYSYTSVDPCDDMTMWTIQEFASTTNNYGVRAVRLLAPAPVATNCAVTTNIAQGQSNVSIALTGTGFFQPDASVGSCRILLGSSVSGSGVTVNSLTYNSPTSLSLNVSASAGAAAGARTITVTNPDAQTSVASSCINVTAGTPTTITSLNRVGSSAVCAGQSLDWQAIFSESITGGGNANFGLNGGTGASVTGVTGSGSTRTVAANVGTGAGSLRLDMLNSTGVTPAPTNLPFTGETITVNANPTAATVTGGGAYCAGGSGSLVGLSGSQSGVNYQLLRDSSPTGSPVAGTGAAISFGNQPTVGSYTVSASHGTTSCAATMTGSVAVSVNANPTAFSVTGGGAFCAGGAGMTVGLSGSQSGISYQLLRDASPVGAPVAGTGSALNFGNQTTAGNYTVEASNGATSCAATMTGNAVVSVNSNPTAFAMTGGGSFCAGGTGVPVGLGNSGTGINYQLMRNGSPTGSPVAGTGAALDFGNQTVAGNYTVEASNATTACSATMSGNASVSINAAPSVNAQTPSAICTGTATSIALTSTPGGASFAYTASNTSGSVAGFANGSANPILQTLTGSGSVTYATTATLNTCPSTPVNIVQPVSDPTPAAGSLASATEQLAYSAQLSAPGSLQAAQFQLVSGTLPSGLTLTSGGLLSGTPDAQGTFNFTVSGSDLSIVSCTFNRAYSVTVLASSIFQNEFE